MASSKLSAGGMQRLLECSVCLEVYQIPSKVPKTLLCGHTFCSPCLKNLVESNHITCSKCRQTTKLPIGEVDELVTNFTALDFVETSCEECRDQQWATRCSHCHKNICETCHTAHLELAIGYTNVCKSLTEAKQTIQQIADTCNDDTYLNDVSDKAEEAEKEVIEYWDGVAAEVEERKRQDLLKIKHHYAEVCEEYIQWKENFQMSVVKGKSALDKYSTTYGRKSSSFITVEKFEEITLKVKKLLVDLKSNVRHKPSMIGYQINLKTTSLQCVIEKGIVKIVCDATPQHHNILMQPKGRNFQLPQYDRATYSKTYRFGPGLPFKPWDVASCHKTGNIVVSDYHNHMIHILNSSLELLSTSDHNDYRYPREMAFSPTTGELYVVDSGNNCVKVLGAEIILSGKHRGIAVDRSGLIYVCDKRNGIKVIHRSGMHIIRFGAIGSGRGQFRNQPCFIAVSQDDKVVVSDWDGYLYIYTCQGQHIRTIRTNQPGSFLNATGVTVDSFGNIIVADQIGRLVVLREDGQVVCRIGSPGQGPGQLKWPRGVALTPAGDIVVADKGNNRIQLFKVPKA